MCLANTARMKKPTKKSKSKGSAVKGNTTNKRSAADGLLVGKTDIGGREGILTQLPDGKPLRLGGGEVVINEKSSTKHCETLSKINVEGGGVKFDCDLQKVANTDRASGKMPKDEYHQENAAGGKQTSNDISDIIKILRENKFYSERNLNFTQLAVFVNLVIDEYLIYDKNNPIITRFNEAVYFEPSVKHIEREGNLKSTIEYASHFVTGIVNEKRTFDKSKMDALQFLIPVLKSQDVQRLIQRPDASKNRQAATIYAKEFSTGGDMCIILVAEINKNGSIRAITFVPKNKYGYIQKQKASNVWLDASVILPPSYEQPSVEGSRTKKADGGISLDSINEGTKNNDRIHINLYNADNRVVYSGFAGDVPVDQLYQKYRASEKMPKDEWHQEDAATGIQTNNITKDELRDVLSGKSQDSAGKAIRAIVAHIEGNRRSGKISRRDGESKKEEQRVLIQYINDFPKTPGHVAFGIYAFVTIAPLFISSVRRISLFGILILISFFITGILYKEYLTSVWCFFAALISTVVYLIIRESRAEFSLNNLRLKKLLSDHTQWIRR